MCCATSEVCAITALYGATTESLTNNDIVLVDTDCCQPGSQEVEDRHSGVASEMNIPLLSPPRRSLQHHAHTETPRTTALHWNCSDYIHSETMHSNAQEAELAANVKETRAARHSRSACTIYD